MSTINKTFLRVLLAIACCIALAFSGSARRWRP